MLRKISIALFIFFTSVCVFSQTEKYNAPVKWERYKVSEKDVSVLFPKLPIMLSGGNICVQEETKKYAVYAETVVYGLNVTYKTKQAVESYNCPVNKKFDERNFEDRLKQLKAELKIDRETKLSQNGSEVVKIENEFFTYWLINDFGNKRWFELWTTDTTGTNINVKNFIESIKIEKKPSGIEIAKGSSRTLGDETANGKIKVETDEKKLADDSKESIPIRIIIKPRASYTDAARQSQFQGVVRLRVTFLATGGIGSISVVNPAAYGISEQAIAAAAKIVFIPAKRNNTPYSVTKIVEYSFTIY